MAQSPWGFLSRLAGKDKRLSLSSGETAAIADQLEDAIAADRREVLGLASSELEAFFRQLLHLSPAGGQAAARGAPSASDEAAAAFTLGQVSFAQTLASRAYQKSADDAFVDMIKSPKYEGYVRALAEQPLNGQDLAQRLKVAPETVSRRLPELREMGITDFRRSGVQLINFLTPAAKTVVEGLGLAPLPGVDGQPAEVKRAFFVLTNELPSVFQSAPGFAPKAEAAGQAA